MFGIYGYKGRIPASFMECFHIAFAPKDQNYIQEDDFTELDREQTKNYIEYGDPFYEPELWDDEE